MTPKPRKYIFQPTPKAQKWPPKTTKIDQKSNSGPQLEKSQKKLGFPQWWASSWATFVWFWRSFWGPNLHTKSTFLQLKSWRDFEQHFPMIFGVLGMFFWLFFQPQGSSILSISFRRNTNFHFSMVVFSWEYCNLAKSTSIFSWGSWCSQNYIV